MNDMARIIVVDDEEEIREMIEEYLSGQGFAVTTAANGAELRETLKDLSPDLVILDLKMPGEDGLSLVRHVRENHSAGIIMVTGAGTVVDRVVGLEVGADDYIAKPFDPRELLARIRSVLRRIEAIQEVKERPARASAAAAAETIKFGRCFLDLNAHTLTTADGEDVPLTSMEFDLLKAFAENPNRVLTRDRLLDLAHRRDSDPFDRSIDIRITRIRRKIEADPAKPQTIKTLRGSGYMFVPAAEG